MAAILEDDIDVDLDDSLTDTFIRASKHLPSLLPLDNQILLNLYAYYKQGTEGPCNVPKPSWYDLKSKSKWEAWSKLGNMSQTEAKSLYIEEISRIDPNFEDASLVNSSWVSVSRMVNRNSPATSLTDYVKDGDCAKVLDALKGCNNINALDGDGMGLIHWAADRGDVQILKILIESGVDIDLIDADGQSALHYAASCDHADCVQLLLAHGARKDLRNNDGHYPVDVANDGYVKELLKTYM